MKVDLNSRLSYENNLRSMKSTFTSPIKNTRVGTPKTLKSPALFSISFGSSNKIKGQKAFYGAELPPYSKVGGVAVVLNDLKKRGIMFTPYYNGKIEYNAEGRPTGKVSVHRLEDGTPFYTKADLTKKTIKEVIDSKDYVKLEEVAGATMPWGTEENSRIAMYKVVDAGIPEGQKHYMVFAEGTASMPVPYANNIAYSSTANPKAKGWEGNPYFMTAKAFVELLPKLSEKDKDVAPQFLNCADAQSAGVAWYMGIKKGEGSPYYKDVSSSFTGHNLGDSYRGELSPKDMWVSLGATKKDIENVEDDKSYIEALKKGEGAVNAYFAAKIPMAMDETNTPSSVSLIMKMIQDNQMTGANVVSEGYSDAIFENPATSRGIHEAWRKLSESGKVVGIMNGFEDANVSAYKPIPLPGYGKNIAVLKNGTAVVEGNDGKYKAGGQEVDPSQISEQVPKFEVFNENSSLEDVLATKSRNTQKLLERLSGKYTQSEVLTGLSGKKVALIGAIDSKYAEEASKGNVDLLVSWGRGDQQKGHDITLEAWSEFAKTPEGKKSVLVLGGELPENEEGENIRRQLEKMSFDPELKGRFVFMDGFAPGYALSSAADAAIFASRFEPCGLTDIEAWRYFCTTVVSNTHGFAQKTFDPRNEAEKEKSNGYKTSMPYDFDNKYLDMIRADFSIDNEDTRPNREELRKTFKGVNDKTFEDFAKQSSKMLLGLENLLLLRGVEENKAKELSYKVMIGAYKDNLTKDERDVADAYRKLVRTLRDNISRDQLVEALKARFSHKNDDVAAKILENHKKSKTGWDDNGMYSRTGLPSWELYEKHLFKDEPTKGVAKPVFSTAGDSYVSGRRSGDKVIVRETSNEEAIKRLKESASRINADELD